MPPTSASSMAGGFRQDEASRSSILSMEDVDDGVPFELVKIGDAHVDNRKPNSKVRWRGSSLAARFAATGRVGRPPGRFCDVDIGGHNTVRTSSTYCT